MKKIILGLSIAAAIAVSCKKEGCKDVDATNYNSVATKDDGSCSYSGSVIFWWNETTRNQMYVDADAEYIKLYVDNEVFATSDVIYTSWTSAPNCESTGSYKYTLNLGSEKTASKSYKVVGDLGNVIFSGTANFTAGSCTSIQLQN